MSFLTKVFGGKKEDKPPTTGKAIQKLRETEEMLIKKQDFLENKIEQEIAIARKHGMKNKIGTCVLIFDLLTSTQL
jgi:charged multivesicular body protein 4